MANKPALLQIARHAMQMAKITGSLALFCLRLPLYFLAFLLFCLMASGVYCLISLYQDFQDIPTDSKEIAAVITQFGQQLLAPRTIPDVNNINQNITEPLSLLAIPPIAPDFSVDNHATETTASTLANTDLRTSAVNHAQECFAFLAPRSTSSSYTQAQNTVATAQESKTATLPAVIHVATPVSVSSSVSASPPSWLVPSSASRSPRSVAERMAANNKAVDEQVDAALKSRKLARQKSLVAATQVSKQKKDHAKAVVNADYQSVITGS